MRSSPALTPFLLGEGRGGALRSMREKRGLLLVAIVERAGAIDGRHAVRIQRSRLACGRRRILGREEIPHECAKRDIFRSILTTEDAHVDFDRCPDQAFGNCTSEILVRDQFHTEDVV